MLALSMPVFLKFCKLLYTNVIKIYVRLLLYTFESYLGHDDSTETQLSSELSHLLHTYAP